MFQKVILQRSKSSDYIILYRMKVRIMHLVMSEAQFKKKNVRTLFQCQKKLYEYHVYEQMSAGIGSSVYNDQNYDTVYFDEELAHDFASWVSGDSMEPKYQMDLQLLFEKQGSIMMVQYMQQSAINQTYIKRVYQEEQGLRLVLSIQNIEIFFFRMMKILELQGLLQGISLPVEQ